MEENRSKCHDLTREGERLFRLHKYEQGITFLERALDVGTDDFQLLSAIYCQLGNAHVMLKDYESALKFHTYDILVERMLGNKEGEAKSCANLGSIFKMKGSFNDALSFTFRQLEFAEELKDLLLESRAYYNIGTIYIERGRFTKLHMTEEDEEEKTREATSDFENAIKYFTMNLELAQKAEDALTTGRCYGSLGNTYYCLGNYEKSIHYHKLRLELSQQYGDRASMRRAHANIANCHALKSDMPAAIKHYRLAYNIASELSNRSEEAQMAYSLANALYITKDFPKAITYFLRHLDIARKLEDKSGQLRSYYSLAQAFQNIRDFRKSLYFLVLAKRMALQVEDTNTIVDIDNLLKEILDAAKSTVLIDNTEIIIDPSADPHGPQIENNETLLSFFKKRTLTDRPVNDAEDPHAGDRYDKEEFFDMLARLQSKRMNDQRVDVTLLNPDRPVKTRRQADTEPDNSSTDGSEVLIDLLLNAQGRRMEDQRAPFLPGLNEHGQLILRRLNTENSTDELDSHLVEWLMRVQSQRLDDQRSELPKALRQDGVHPLSFRQSSPPKAGSSSAPSTSAASSPLPKNKAKEEEDVTNIVLRMQVGRLEDQRAHLPSTSSSSN
ncbi:unnamed protein product [Caenorhabditis angaria]|uniref:Uncharacterized protein n=1 Tax=Caenorhabditis angaria TaxID=860376 RepID=A0A9P1N9D3_9PELO|nr:unnamed protein product [Caenorhabditis angaria]